ncbi:P2Y purinoceptor 4-like [Protopterus annectens]|uniref:P2Y purinoceptor 4-like n=1 Tax=Protopterus annectens TaxID=7888 RepID=UPI001CFA539C|nr:P2Y purinoceptor 4-like [Protopterus annectens]
MESNHTEVKMNRTGNISDCSSNSMHISVPCSLIAILVAGCILNSVSLWIFFFRIKKWKTGVILQFNLALTDAIMMPAAPFMIVYFMLDGHWPFPQIFCQLKVFLMSTHLYGSIYFLMLISMHRYVVVVRYKKKSILKDPVAIKRICIVVWTVLFVQGLPLFIFLKTSMINNSIKCLNIHQNEMTTLFFIYNTLFLLPSFLFPFLVSLVCYSILGCFICKKKPVKDKAVHTKSLQMITVSLIIFLICFAPLSITRTVGVVIKMWFPSFCEVLLKVEMGYYISWTLTAANCCLDPILYCFASETFSAQFRTSLKNIKKRRKK